MHDFSEREWAEYIDGIADEETRNRLEAHLFGCLSCWEFYDRMASTTEELRVAGDVLRRVHNAGDRALYNGLQRIFEKLGGEGAELAGSIQQRLGALTDVMAPMCGSQTALKALRAAAEDSPARSLDHLTEDNWAPFMKNLRSIATVVCGDTGAHLVWERGKLY